MKFKKIFYLLFLIIFIFINSMITSDRNSIIKNASKIFYVAKNGSDKNNGLINHPWLTLQKAFNSAVPGSVVLIKEGVYNEKITVNVSGNSSSGFITFMPYQNNKVIISGNKIKAENDDYGDNIILINNKNHIRIMGFDIRESRVNDGSAIRVYGSANHIEIINNKIHKILGSNAMGITVYGEDGAGITDINIAGNEIYDCEPSKSEALTLNGNIKNFKIINNTVHDVNNIAIDMIGGEDWLSSAQIRSGICSGNIVYNTHSKYGGGYAAGIYIDGGIDIIVERNKIFNSDLGIEVGAENPGIKVKNIIVRNNIIFNNDKGGIVFGGYDEKRGIVEDCYFLNNTCYNNNKVKANGEIWAQISKNNYIMNNIFYAVEDKKKNLIILSINNENHTNIFNNNVYYSGKKSDNLFVINGDSFKTFEEYIKKTNQDKRSFFKNPLFKSSDVNNINFNLLDNSICIDKGFNHNNAGSIDYAGNKRIINNIDIGALERR